MVKKPPVLLKDNVYQALKEKAGAKNVSKLINKNRYGISHERGSMFGSMKKVNVSDLRDRSDRLSPTP